MEGTRPDPSRRLYVGGYALGRLWVEALRIDHANRILGLRINEWVSIVLLATSLALLVTDHWRRGRDADQPSSDTDSPTTPVDAGTIV